MSKVTKEEMLEFLRTVRANGGFNIMLEKWWTQKEQDMFDAVSNFISRADDVERLVSAAMEYIEDNSTVKGLRLCSALAPFMEKDKGDVPIINEEGHSNEEKP